MTYEQFIGTLMQHETSHVKALSFPESCSPRRIPDNFLVLLPAIIKILDRQKSKLCQINQIVALFGLQAAPVAIKSSLPITSQRIIDARNPEQHLCCSLAYLITCTHTLSQIKSWEGAENIIVDFTSGEIMDGNYYLAKLANTPGKRSRLYGVLDSSRLDSVWKNLHTAS
jgi:hypothetical protein